MARSLCACVDAYECDSCAELAVDTAGVFFDVRTRFGANDVGGVFFLAGEYPGIFELCGIWSCGCDAVMTVYPAGAGCEGGDGWSDVMLEKQVVPVERVSATSHQLLGGMVEAYL